MALPQDGQEANGLTKVTEISAGKELMFIDPTTNEGGIITLEDLTKQILNGITTQAFKMDAGTQTIPAAINYLFGNIGPFKFAKKLDGDDTENQIKLNGFVTYLLFISHPFGTNAIFMISTASELGTVTTIVDSNNVTCTLDKTLLSVKIKGAGKIYLYRIGSIA